MTAHRIKLDGRNAWVRPCRLMDWQRQAQHGPLDIDVPGEVLATAGWSAALFLTFTLAVVAFA